MLKVVFGIMSAAMLWGCVSGTEDRDYRTDWSRYGYDRPDPIYGNYYADRYHRDDPRRYREWQLSSQEGSIAVRMGGITAAVPMAPPG